MAVRQFNGTSDYIQLGAPAGSIQLAAGAFTVMALVKPSSPGASLDAYVSPSRTTSSSTLAELGQGTSGVDVVTHTNYSDGTVSNAPGDTIAGNWQWWVIAKASGTGIPVRCSAYRYRTSDWSHQNSTVNVGTAPTDIWTLTNIGRRGTGTNFANFQIAVAAVFTSNLSDGTLESMIAPNTTAAVFAQGPVALWEFNQDDVSTTVTDLVGSANETARSGTTVVTGSDPTWTFGLTAPQRKIQVVTSNLRW